MAHQGTFLSLALLLVLQRGPHSADGAVYPSEATGVEWAENFTLRNLEAETSRPAEQSPRPQCLTQDPVTFCTQYCVKPMDFCSSFSYWTTTSHCVCKMYKTPYWALENMNAREGARYFYARNDSCPVHRGYTLLHFDAKRSMCVKYLGKMALDSYTARQMCGVHDGVLPKLTNIYVTKVITEFIGANLKGVVTLKIEAGARKVDKVWRWDLDGTPVSTEPRSAKENSREDPTYWTHTYWSRTAGRADFTRDCMYTDENGWFTDSCAAVQKDLVCQYRFEGEPWEGIADPMPSTIKPTIKPQNQSHKTPQGSQGGVPPLSGQASLASLLAVGGLAVAVSRLLVAVLWRI